MSGTITLRLTVEGARRLRAATEAGYLLDAAGRVFGLLRAGISGGFLTLDDAAAILGLAELAERALDNAAEVEGTSCPALARRLTKPFARQATEGGTPAGGANRDPVEPTEGASARRQDEAAPGR